LIEEYAMMKDKHSEILIKNYIEESKKKIPDTEPK